MMTESELFEGKDRPEWAEWLAQDAGSAIYFAHQPGKNWANSTQAIPGFMFAGEIEGVVSLLIPGSLFRWSPSEHKFIQVTGEE